jgi:hypothetical protein
VRTDGKKLARKMLELNENWFCFSESARKDCRSLAEKLGRRTG